MSDPQIDPTDSQEANTAPNQRKQYRISRKSTNPTKSASQVNTRVNTIHKIDVAEAIKLRLVKGYLLKDIANRYNVSVAAVSKRLSTVFELLKDDNTTNATQVYKENQAELLDSVSMKMLSVAVEPEKLKKLSSNQAIWNFGVLFDKSRICKGLSTDNINILALTGDISEITKQRLELHKKLADMTGTHDTPVDK